MNPIASPIHRRTLLLGLAALTATGRTLAQDAYPSRALKMIVAQPPGNSADLVARMLAERLARALGQAVVVDNRPGASGSIGVAAIASAAPDGYTIGIGGIGQLALNPSLYSKLPYDAQNGFTHLAIVYRGPMLILVDAASPIASLKDLVSQSQAAPAGLDFTSAGAGSIMHLTGEHFMRVARAKMLHVPSRGTAAATTLVLGKHAAMLVENVTAGMPFVRSGQLRALAITSAQRHPSLPDVPSIVEAGFPGLVTEGWLSLSGPAGLPAPVRDRLAQEVRKIVQQPDFQSWTMNSGGLVEPMRPEQADAYVRAEASRWSELIRSVGLKLD
jgi:tripartite-type tricarboxylate transporter receptor subunit TctC